MVKDLQRVLNAARKAEGRVSKIQSEVLDKKKMWTPVTRPIWTTSTRTSRKRCWHDAAREEVRRVAAGQNAQPMEVIGPEVDAQFEALMAGETFSWTKLYCKGLFRQRRPDFLPRLQVELQILARHFPHTCVAETVQMRKRAHSSSCWTTIRTVPGCGYGCYTGGGDGLSSPCGAAEVFG